MRRRTKIVAAGAATAALAAAAVGVAVAGTGDDDGTEQPITGAALERARAAALARTGEGRVTDTEVGDEEGFYEVEVTLDDGRQVDVHLDENFEFLGDEPDSDDEEDGD